MSTSHTSLRAFVTLALTVSGVAACTSSPESSAESDRLRTSAAAPAPTLELTIGTDDTVDTPAGEQIQVFQREVARRSDGAVTIKPVWEAAGEDVPHWDQAVASLLISGDIDLALIPSRAWDDLGVTSLTALNAPFLVDSDQLTERVVTDLGDQLMAGLPAVGVTGLALLPEGLRHPFGFEDPLLGADDYQGATIRAPYSRTTTAMFEALGAKATDAPADPSVHRGIEGSYALARGGTATGNVVFYPKVNALVINDDVRTALSPEQWSTLTAAAQATQSWVFDNNPTDNEAAEKFCSEGGRIVAANDTDLSSLVEATRPMVEGLAEDPDTADLIARIEEMKPTIGAPHPRTSCPARDEALSRLDGVYTTIVTEKSLQRTGAVSEATIDEQAGRYTITLDNGAWRMEQIYATGPNKGSTWHGSGHFTLDDGRMRWFWSHAPGEWTEADVTVEPDGSLTFRRITDGAGPEAVLVSKQQFRHWTRIRDVP